MIARRSRTHFKIDPARDTALDSLSDAHLLFVNKYGTRSAPEQSMS